MKSKKTNNSDDPNKPWWLLILILLGLFILNFFVSLFREKRSKLEMAKEYGVSVKVLMKWIKMFCPAEYVQQYVGTKKKKIPTYILRQTIGEAKSYPTCKGKAIISKSDLERAFFVGSTTLLESIKSISDPLVEIGMTYQQYRSLKKIPPLYMNKIVAYMIKKGYDATRIESVSSLIHYDSKIVDFSNHSTHLWEKR